MESTPEPKPVAQEENFTYTEPVRLKVTLWLDVELPRKDLYPDWFRHHIETICSEIHWLTKTHSCYRPAVVSATCDEVITYENARDLRVVRRKPGDEAG